MPGRSICSAPATSMMLSTTGEGGPGPGPAPPASSAAPPATKGRRPKPVLSILLLSSRQFLIRRWHADTASANASRDRRRLFDRVGAAGSTGRKRRLRGTDQAQIYCRDADTEARGVDVCSALPDTLGRLCGALRTDGRGRGWVARRSLQCRIAPASDEPPCRSGSHLFRPDRALE